MLKQTYKKAHTAQKLFASLMISVLLLQGSQDLVMSVAINRTEIYVQTDEEPTIFESGEVKIPIQVNYNPGISCYEIAMELSPELMPYMTGIEYGDVITTGGFMSTENLTYDENTIWFMNLAMSNDHTNGTIANLILDIADIPEGQYPITLDVRKLYQADFTQIKNFIVTDGVLLVERNILGDLDGDLAITMNDYTLIMNHYIMVSLLPPELVKNADINGNGTIEMSDIVAIQQAAQGFTSLPTNKTLQIVSAN